MIKTITRFLTLLGFLFLAGTTFGQCDITNCPVAPCYCISETTVTDERGTLYDDGGSENDYLPGEVATTQVITYLFNIQPASNPDTIALQFTFFDVEQSASCEYDHLEILDGNVTKGIFCGTDSPGLVYCTGGSVTIRWFSDPNAVRPGFEMRWFADSVPDAGSVPTPTGYCDPSNDGDCGNGTGIYEVNMPGEQGGFSNITDLQNCQDNLGYSDFSGTHFAYLNRGTVYELETFSNSNGYFFGQMGVWIDWNEDFDFDDVGELIITQSTFTGGDVVGQTTPIQIPDGTTDGIKRMRIRAHSTSNPLTPCGPRGLGETEDYSIIVGTPPPFCSSINAPVDMAVNQCQTGITFSWNSPSSGEEPTGYKFSLGSDEAPKNVLFEVDLGLDTFYTYMGELEADSTYFWKVVPYNAQGDATGCPKWSFTTAAAGDPRPQIVFDRNVFDTINTCFSFQDPLFASVSGGAGTIAYNWAADDMARIGVTDKDSTQFSSSAEGDTKVWITVTDDNGCSGSDTVIVTTNPNANAGGTLVGKSELCAQDELSLSASTTFGDLQWQRNSGSDWIDLTGQTTNTYSNINPQDGISYRLLASTEFCNDTSEVVDITVYELTAAPTISTPFGVFEFCKNDSLELNSSEAANNLWSTGETDQDIFAKSGGLVELVFLDANSCTSDVATVTVTELDLPVQPNILQASNGEATLCEGGTAILSTDGEGIIEWNGNASESDDTLSISVAGDVYVTVTNSNGCKATSDTIELVERALPAKPTVNSSTGAADLCEGDQMELVAQTPESTVYWEGDPANDGDRFVISEGGDYTATAVSDFGCERESDPFTVTQRANPTPATLTTENNAPGFCEEDSLAVTANGSTNIYWNDDPSVVGPTIYVFSGGEVFATSINEFGCESNSDTLDIIEYPLPEMPIVTNNNGDLESSVTNPSLDYQWFDDQGNPVEGETGPIFENAPDGMYYLVVTVPETGCSNTSSTFTGIKVINGNDLFTLYPNPISVGEVLKIKGLQRESTIKVTDNLGRELVKTTSDEISTEGFQSGVYFMQISEANTNNVYALKFVVK